MIKKALQIEELMLSTNSSITEDYIENTDVIINSQTNSNSFFINSRKSGKEIIINGTYINNNSNFNPSRYGFNYNLHGYSYELKSLVNNKILRLLAVAQDDRIYSINVKVKQVDITNITLDSFAYNISCYSDTSYWLDVTDLLYYSILLKDRYFPTLYNYNNDIKFNKNEIIKDRLVVIEPLDEFGITKIKENKKFYFFNKNTYQIQANGEFYLYLMISHIPNMKVSINNTIYQLDGNSVALNTSSFADCITVSYHVNNNIPDFDVISYVVLSRKI